MPETDQKPEPAPPVRYTRPPIDPQLLSTQGAAQKSVLPGHNGVPFRGPVPFLKDEDTDDGQPQVGYEVRVDIFELRDEVDRAYYSQVWQLASSGFAQKFLAVSISEENCFASAVNSLNLPSSLFIMLHSSVVLPSHLVRLFCKMTMSFLFISVLAASS